MGLSRYAVRSISAVLNILMHGPVAAASLIFRTGKYSKLDIKALEAIKSYDAEHDHIVRAAGQRYGITSIVPCIPKTL
jgi:hypothetical protein